MTRIIQGSIIEIQHATPAGIETILGTVVMGEESETGELTHITVQGQVLTITIGEMVIPVERPIVLEMIPIEPKHSHLLKVRQIG